MKKYLLTLMLSAAVSLSAQVFDFYEGFDYTAGGTATGWAGTNIEVVAGSLNYTATGAALPASGNSLRIVNPQRALYDAVTGIPYTDATTQTVWISYLMKPGYLDGYYTVFETSPSSDFTGAGPRSMAIGQTDLGGVFNATFNLSINNNNAGHVEIGTELTDTEVNLFVVKVEMVNGGQDSVTAWRNPTVAQLTGETGGTTLTMETFNGIDYIGLTNFSGNGNPIFDEIRMGPSLSSVAVPEPSTYALIVGLAALLALYQRRRMN
ncbi:MAG: PEP-CTERM sorting domain-containing protein [Puniceicoccaceae bacterium]